MATAKTWIHVSCDRCNGEGTIILKGLLEGQEIIGDTISPCPKCAGKGTVKWGYFKEGEEE